MCEKCDKLVELIKQTEDGKSYVRGTFPNGEYELITPEEPNSDSD